MRSKRKDEHVKLALQQNIKKNDFDKLKFDYISIPNIDYKDVCLETEYLGHKFKYPFYINAMTGGSQKTLEINRRLAFIAKTYDLMMVVGSQHAALDNPSLEESYKVVREINPKGFIVGNINPNASVEDAFRAIEMIEADALSIHINPIQELSMDEGDRHFSNWLANIENIRKAISIPLIIKEVGFGMSFQTLDLISKLGIDAIDVSGKGGTNFADIEISRSKNASVSYFSDWGYSTVESLMYARKLPRNQDIFASGGIRHALDVIKSIALGAKSVGMSRFFLDLAHLDDQEALHEMDRFIDELKRIMVLLSCQEVEDLKTQPLIDFEGAGETYERK